MIVNETTEEHLIILAKVLSETRSRQLEIRLDKNQFFKRQVIYLRYYVNQFGIQPNPKTSL